MCISLQVFTSLHILQYIFNPYSLEQSNQDRFFFAISEHLWWFTSSTTIMGESSIFIEILLLSNNHGSNLLAQSIVLYKLCVRLISKESTDGSLLDRLRDWNKRKYQYYLCVEMATLSWRQSAKHLKFIVKQLVSILRRGIFFIFGVECSAHTISERYYE